MKYAKMVGLLMASLTAACGATDPADTSARAGQHSKELTISDETGENLVFIKLTSDDLDALEAYRESSFTLVPIAAEELRPDGEMAPSAEGPNGSDAQAPALDEAQGVSLKILGEELADGVMGYRLVDNLQANYRDPFVVVYRYTYNDCAIVQRVSTFNKVYVSLESQQSSGGLWSVFLNEVQLDHNELVDSCDPASYQVRARIERRNSNDYTFSSHN